MQAAENVQNDTHWSCSQQEVRRSLLEGIKSAKISPFGLFSWCFWKAFLMMFLKSFMLFSNPMDVFSDSYFHFTRTCQIFNSRIKENALDRFLKAKQTVSDATPAGWIYHKWIILEKHPVAYPISQLLTCAIVSVWHCLPTTNLWNLLLFINYLQLYKSESCEIECENSCL